MNPLRSVTLLLYPILACGLVLSLGPLAQSSPAMCSVSGTVKSASAGPISVSLWSVGFNSQFSYEYSVNSAADGTFNIQDVEPGIYVLIMRGSGYIPVEYGAQGPNLQGIPIKLTAGQQLKGLELTASPRRLICGRLTDEQGRPLANQAVGLLSYGEGPFSHGEGGVFLETVAETVYTNPAGDFRFPDRKPGAYFLSAVPGNYVVWFPSATSFQNAKPIQVGLAMSTACQDNIQVRPLPAIFHVRGKVEGSIAPTLGDRFYVSLIEETATGFKQWHSRIVEADHTFDIDGIQSGRYRLVLTGVDGTEDYRRNAQLNLSVNGAAPPHLELATQQIGAAPPPLELATRQIVVHDANVDVTLKLIQLASISGQIKMKDQFSEQWPVITIKDEHSGQMQDSRIAPDGSFNFPHLDPGTYHVKYLSGPIGKYVLQDGRPLNRAQIKVGAGRSIQIAIVSMGEGEVEAYVEPSLPAAGVFRDEHGRPRIIPEQQVLLIPDPLPPIDFGIVTGSVTASGLIALTNVPPGRYRAVSGENVNLVWWSEHPAWRDRTFVKAVAALGKPVEVKEGQKTKIRLQALTAELQVLMAKFRVPASYLDHCVGGCSIDLLWFGADAITKAQAER